MESGSGDGGDNIYSLNSILINVYKTGLYISYSISIPELVFHILQILKKIL